MAIYYRFKSAKDYDSITIEGQFISVFNLKQRIFESKRFGRGNDFDLIVTNSQTNQEYVDEATLIPRNTSVLIRRVPGLPRKPIVASVCRSRAEINVADEQVAKSNSTTAVSSLEASDLDDDFGDDIYATISLVTTKLSNISMQDSSGNAPYNLDPIAPVIPPQRYIYDAELLLSNKLKRKREHEYRSSGSDLSNEKSLEHVNHIVSRQSLKRKAEHQYEDGHDYDSKTHRHDLSIDDDRHFKRKAPRETWLGADQDSWRWHHNHSIKC
ncbi:hypothetical protein vseg_019858 [Gypsophila vaccaria]